MDYVAFLRGINVGGHFVRMEDLRSLFETLKFRNVRTYIQSGNVFFDTDEANRKRLESKIEQRLEETLGYEVAVMLRTVQELERALAESPFGKVEATPKTRLCVVFAKEPIPKGLNLPLLSPKKDMEILKTTDLEAYVVWHLINGRPPSSQTFLDKNIGKQTTSRFFHTAVKILEAAKGE